MNKQPLQHHIIGGIDLLALLFVLFANSFRCKHVLVWMMGKHQLPMYLLQVILCDTSRQTQYLQGILYPCRGILMHLLFPASACFFFKTTRTLLFFTPFARFLLCLACPFLRLSDGFLPCVFDIIFPQRTLAALFACLLHLIA